MLYWDWICALLFAVINKFTLGRTAASIPILCLHDISLYLVSHCPRKVFSSKWKFETWCYRMMVLIGQLRMPYCSRYRMMIFAVYIFDMYGKIWSQ